jgi:YD repeat-containing protein
MLIGAGALFASANAAETITYTYDEHGRLVKVERSGTINNGVKADYEYDDADNRTRRKVSSPNPPP